MLKEITDLAQTSDEPQRRWFADEYVNLYVWHDSNNRISEFQISYQVNDDDMVLTWNRTNGLSSHRVDSGSNDPSRSKSSPILVEETENDIEYVRRVFEESGQKLEHDLYDFIISRLNT